MSKPNIILIVSDQHRGDWMGCAGHPFVHTPNMDRMAREGIRFTQASCNAPLCGPSRMSMMTGKYPHRVGVYSNSEMLPSDIPTFAHALGLADYETVLCGRMHFVGPDQRHGYQRRLVGDITSSYPGGPVTNYGPLEGTQRQGYRSIELAGPGDSPVLQYDERVTQSCEQFLRERSQQADEQEAPLFLTVGYYGPHTPYTCPPDLFKQAYEAMEGKDFPIQRTDAPSHPWMDDWFNRLQIDHVTAEQIRTVRAAYAGSIGRMDQLVGRVLEAAKALSGDTYVVYLSDHGEMAGDRHMFWKQSFYEGAVHIPMIWYPLRQEAVSNKWKVGREVDYPVSLVDLAPTLAGISGAPSLPGGDGEDLTCLLEVECGPKEAAPWMDRPVFTELNLHSPIRMIRQHNMKLIYYTGYSSFQLFDLVHDPKETVDLSSDPDYEELAQTLLTKLKEDWDPEQIIRQKESKRDAMKYMSSWGKRVGMGPLDLWDGRPDIPLQQAMDSRES